MPNHYPFHDHTAHPTISKETLDAFNMERFRFAASGFHQSPDAARADAVHLLASAMEVGAAASSQATTKLRLPSVPNKPYRSSIW